MSAVWMWGANHKALRSPALCWWYKGTCPYIVLVLCRCGHSIQMLFVQVLDSYTCSGKCRWIITYALLQKILLICYWNRKHAIYRKDVIIRIDLWISHYSKGYFDIQCHRETLLGWGGKNLSACVLVSQCC